MLTRERMPWGLAKQIVAMMRPGDVLNIRPQYSVSFHNAARRMGLRVTLKPFRREGRLMFQLKRIPFNAPTAHYLRPHDLLGHFIAA